jgi:hypothetical protein
VRLLRRVGFCVGAGILGAAAALVVYAAALRLGSSGIALVIAVVVGIALVAACYEWEP